MNYKISEIADLLKSDSRYIGKETEISCLSADSRRILYPEKTLFFALRTENNDGHKYIDELYRLNVRNFVVHRIPDNFKDLKDTNFIVVEDTLAALQRLCAYHRSRFSIPVIGITGSNGKTTTKEFIYQLLKEDYHIVRSPRSFNSQIGVPFSVWEMTGNDDLAIIEAGISRPGEMERLEKIIRPEIGIFTFLGSAHQENFTSMEEKCLEKMKLFKGCKKIILDKDDDTVCSAARQMGYDSRLYTWSRKDPQADVFIEKIDRQAAGTQIVCRTNGKTRTFRIPFTDDASIRNVINAVALISLIKDSALDQTRRFEELEPVAMRLEIKPGQNNCTIINDTYNSDLNSLKIALDFQHNRKQGKKVTTTVILSDILQSGMSSRELYSKVAELISLNGIDRFIGIGKDLKENSSLFDASSEFYTGTEEFIRHTDFKSFVSELILIKGSRSFHFEAITESLAKKVHETTLEVNLDALVHNYNFYRSKLKPETKMVCMVKAFAYGAGSHEIAKTLQEHRCDYLAVAVADEGVELRNEGITIPIMIMNPEMNCLNTLLDYNLEPEVYSFRVLEAIIREAEKRSIRSFPIHLKMDTGMHRLGFEHKDLDRLCDILKSTSSVRVSSIFSHFAGSDSEMFDDFTMGQIENYDFAADKIEKALGYTVIKHILNTAGIERFSQYQKDMVRLGIGLYGVSSFCSKDLRPVSTLKTTILQTRKIKAGDSIGYSRKTFLDRDSIVAVIPIGYADGLNRKLSNRNGYVLVNGCKCPILGNICMDACMIDVTDAHASEGDSVIVFGEELRVETLADIIGTIPYEVLTSVSPRVKRVYYRE